MEGALLRDMNKLPFSVEIFDSINEGIYVLDKSGAYIYCNSAFVKLTGATKETILNLNAFKPVEQGKVPTSVGVMAFKKKKKVSIVNQVLTPTGHHYRQMATATPIFDGHGNVEYVLVEMIRLDIFQKRFQDAVLTENEEPAEWPSEEEEMNAKQTVIAESVQMKELLSMAENVAKVDTTVLVTGETGTGKEVIANFIHHHSPRADHPMIEINCAALPENLLESELFGYEKGAFTGASNSGKAGMIEEAQGGTLFLDEINSLPMALQGKLLRVLESHKSKRIGAVGEKKIDFRLITATNRDLKKCVEEGTFRADLYYRLNVIPLKIPALRHRKEDIIPLAVFFTDFYCEKYGRTKVLSKKILDELLKYEWPGNVRELKNIIERIVITGSVNSAEIQNVPDNFWNDQCVNGIMLENEGLFDDIGWMDIGQIEAGEFSLKSYMELCEKKLLTETLKRYGSSYKAADFLKINQSTIVRKRQKYDI